MKLNNSDRLDKMIKCYERLKLDEITHDEIVAEKKEIDADLTSIVDSLVKSKDDFELLRTAIRRAILIEKVSTAKIFKHFYDIRLTTKNK